VTTDHVTTDHVTTDHVPIYHVKINHVTTSHVTTDHVTTDHVTTDHVTNMLSVVQVKVVIIISLFILTLLAALLPFFCVWQANKRKQQRQIYQLTNGRPSNSATGNDDGICGYFKRKTTINGRTPPPNARNLRKRMSSLRFNKRQSKRLLSSLNCFSGGIFLGTALIGMLPEIQQFFNNYQIGWDGHVIQEHHQVNSTVSEDHDKEGGHGSVLLPIAELLTAVGLFFILSVEQAAHVYNHWRSKNKPDDVTNLGEFPMTVVNDSCQLVVVTSQSETETPQNLPENPPKNLRRNLSDLSRHKNHENDLLHDHHEIRSLMLIVSLSVHSFLEGIAMGLQEKTGSLTAIFVAVLFHKSLMAFSMGTNLVRAKQNSKRILIAAVVLSCMSPAGIICGLLIDWKSSSGAERLPNAILQAIATGTFLYITFFEVLVREFEEGSDRVCKVISLMIGFTAVTLTIYAHHV